MVLSSRELLTCDCYLSMTVCLCENWKLCVCVCVCACARVRVRVQKRLFDRDAHMQTRTRDAQSWLISN